MIIIIIIDNLCRLVQWVELLKMSAKPLWFDKFLIISRASLVEARPKMGFAKAEDVLEASKQRNEIRERILEMSSRYYDAWRCLEGFSRS